MASRKYSPSNLKKYKVQDHKCFYCNEHMKLEEATMDHFFPKSKGFTLLNNKVLACVGCNEGKMDLIPDDILCWKFAQHCFRMKKKEMFGFLREYYKERTKLNKFFSFLGFNPNNIIIKVYE